MPQYVLVLDAHAMDHVPDEDMPDVDRAAHAVSRKAIDAGVWVCGSGLADQRASIVAADGTVTDGPQVDRPRAHGDRGALTRGDAQVGCRVATACRCD
jgi:hypothetical protein